MNETLQGQLQKYFTLRDDVVAAYLFGSQAEGRTGKLSDVDVAVLLNGGSKKELFQKKLEIGGELGNLLKREDIDVVVLNEAPPLISHRVVKNGKLLFTRDEKARLAYEVRAVLRYLDWKPFLEKYTKEVLGV